MWKLVQTSWRKFIYVQGECGWGSSVRNELAVKINVKGDRLAGRPLFWQSACKPGSVPLAGCLSFIYAMCHHIAKAFYPPARASNPQTPVYMNLQPPRHTARTSLHGRWALTPPSHPYPSHLKRRGGYFLLRYSAFTDSFLLGSGVLCAARTFLLCFLGNGDRLSDCLFLCFCLYLHAGLCFAKVRQNGIICKFNCGVLSYRYFYLDVLCRKVC